MRISICINDKICIFTQFESYIHSSYYSCQDGGYRSEVTVCHVMFCCKNVYLMFMYL